MELTRRRKRRCERGKVEEMRKEGGDKCNKGGHKLRHGYKKKQVGRKRDLAGEELRDVKEGKAEEKSQESGWGKNATEHNRSKGLGDLGVQGSQARENRRKKEKNETEGDRGEKWEDEVMAGCKRGKK